MLQLNGKTLQYDKAFSHDGIQYPANWLRLTSLEEKQAIGIVEVPDQPQAVWDQRFYWGVDNPKDHTQLVEQWVAQVKQTAGSMLSPTDWYIVRNSENSSPVPQEVLDRRSEIRSYSNQKETAIEATTTTEELATYVTSPEFSQWEAVEVVEEPEEEPVEEPTSGSSTPISGDEGMDSIIFSGGVVSGSFSAGTTDTLIF